VTTIKLADRGIQRRLRDEVGAVKPKTARLKVGDRGRVRFGGHRFTVVIVEDRGAIGVGGRQIVSVHRTRNITERPWEVAASALTEIKRVTR
jgi:hypothetical protein